MCILDQQDKQILSKKKGEDVLKGILEEAENKKIENTTAVIIFNILAALTMDSLLGRYQIESPSGVIKVRNESVPLYTKAAIAEFSSGYTDFNTVLKDFNSAYLKSFPALYDTTRKVNFRPDNLSNPTVITKVISEMSLYFAMSSIDQGSVGIAFNTEYSKVMKGYDTYVANIPDMTFGEVAERTFRPITNILGTIGSALRGDISIDNPFVTTPEEVQADLAKNKDFQYMIKARSATTFSKIDLYRAIDLNTGLFNGPITSFFIEGYRYFKTLGSNEKQ
jgi:hypothetical protein